MFSGSNAQLKLTSAVTEEEGEAVGCSYVYLVLVPRTVPSTLLALNKNVE